MASAAAKTIRKCDLKYAPNQVGANHASANFLRSLSYLMRAQFSRLKAGFLAIIISRFRCFLAGYFGTDRKLLEGDDSFGQLVGTRP